MKRDYIGNSEENHENLRALEEDCVHCHMKKIYVDNPEENH
jgi:hypothetical protein